MGIDNMKAIIATGSRAEIAAAIDLGNAALQAIDAAEPAALEALKTTHFTAFEQARVAEVSKRLAEIDKPRDNKPVEAEPVKPSEPSKVK